MRQQHMLISQQCVSAGSAWRQVQPEQPSAQGSSRYGFMPQQQPQEQVAVPPALPDGSSAEQREESSTPGFGPGSAGSQWLQAVNIAALTEAQMREQQQQQHKESGPQLTQTMWTDAPAQAMVCCGASQLTSVLNLMYACVVIQCYTRLVACMLLSAAAKGLWFVCIVLAD